MLVCTKACFIWQYPSTQLPALHARVFDVLLCQVGGEGQQKVPVRITTQHNVKFGEVIKIVGGGPDLGDWNPEAGPRELLYKQQAPVLHKFRHGCTKAS